MAQQKVTTNPLIESLGGYDPNLGRNTEKRYRNKAMASAIGNVFRNMIDSYSVGQGAPASNVGNPAYQQYQGVLNQNMIQDQEVNALKLQDQMRKQYQERGWERDDTVMDRQNKERIEAEKRGQNWTIETEKRGDTRQITQEQRTWGRQDIVMDKQFENQKELGDISNKQALGRIKYSSEMARKETEAKYKVMASYQEQIAKFEQTKKANEGYVNLYEPVGDGTDQVQFYGTIDEGMANQLFNAIMENEDAKEDFKVMKGAWQGTTSELKKVIIAGHWYKVKGLLDGQPAQGTTSAPEGDPNMNRILQGGDKGQSLKKMEAKAMEAGKQPADATRVNEEFFDWFK